MCCVVVFREMTPTTKHTECWLDLDSNETTTAAAAAVLIVGFMMFHEEIFVFEIVITYLCVCVLCRMQKQSHSCVIELCNWRINRNNNMSQQSRANKNTTLCSLSCTESQLYFSRLFSFRIVVSVCFYHFCIKYSSLKTATKRASSRADSVEKYVLEDFCI